MERLAVKRPAEIVAAIAEGVPALNTLGCTGATAEKLAQIAMSKRHEIEEAATRDRVVVEVNLAAPSGESWTSVERVSPGQRSMAMLALALVRDTGPLIIDQPEDDLDNRFIFDDVVGLLTRVCAKRQVIVATHNANIPILGDAEMVLALDAVSDRSQILAAGGLEEPSVAEYARRILEGGDEAFRSRHRRYLFAPHST